MNSTCESCRYPRQDWMPDMPPMPICCGHSSSPKFNQEIEAADFCAYHEFKHNIFEFAYLGMERP